MVVKFNHVDHGGSIIPEIDIAGLTAGEAGKISPAKFSNKEEQTSFSGNRPRDILEESFR
jgi:hypothetical protein